jgi:hypothetical protein
MDRYYKNDRKLRMLKLIQFTYFSISTVLAYFTKGVRAAFKFSSGAGAA